MSVSALPPDVRLSVKEEFERFLLEQASVRLEGFEPAPLGVLAVSPPWDYTSIAAAWRLQSLGLPVPFLDRALQAGWIEVEFSHSCLDSPCRLEPNGFAESGEWSRWREEATTIGLFDSSEPVAPTGGKTGTTAEPAQVDPHMDGTVLRGSGWRVLSDRILPSRARYQLHVEVAQATGLKSLVLPVVVLGGWPGPGGRVVECSLV